MTIFICPICNTKKQIKHDYESHVALCKITSISAKVNMYQVANYERDPTNREIFQIVITLCEENAKLKKRIEYIETNVKIHKKRSIDDYLLSLSSSSIMPFQDWLASVIVTDDDFQLLIDKSLTDCLKQMLIRSLQSQTTDLYIPFKAFKQRQNQIYLFNDNKWNQMTTPEFISLLTILSQRIVRKYLQWKNENREAIETNQHMQEVDIQYMSKSIGSGKSIESRVSEIKKAIYSTIHENIDR
jgi:hypothetical protein